MILYHLIGYLQKKTKNLDGLTPFAMQQTRHLLISPEAREFVRNILNSQTTRPELQSLKTIAIQAHSITSLCKCQFDLFIINKS